jgi:hypothetical protein
MSWVCLDQFIKTDLVLVQRFYGEKGFERRFRMKSHFCTLAEHSLGITMHVCKLYAPLCNIVQ